jgi:nucleoporin NDC1
LTCIAQRFEGRRKAIFEDIDRKGGSTWSQILDACLGVIDGMNSRITEYLTPPPPPQPIEEPGLPRLTGPLKEDDILSPVPKRKMTGDTIARYVSSTIKAHSHPQDGSPILKAIEKSSAQVLSRGMGKESSPVGSPEKHTLSSRVLQSPLGWPFRQTFRRRIAVIVLGSPHGYVGLIVDAVDAVARLAVCSLKEDPYGNVQRDVARIIRTFTATITRLESFKVSLDTHWTDVEQKRDSPEVDTILTSLKSGLHDLLEAFGDYAEELRLSQSDMKSAREAATPLPTKAIVEEGAEAQKGQKDNDKSDREVTTSRAKKPIEMREWPRDRRRPRTSSPLAATGEERRGNAGGRQSSFSAAMEDAGERR